MDTTMQLPIYYVVESGGLCGGVRVIFEHATRLVKRGHQVVIASLNPYPGWFDLGGVEWQQYGDYIDIKEALKDKRGKKIATWWRTSPVVRDVSKEGEGYYLIQDIETNYYWRPIEKSTVLKTYQYGLKHFTDDKWVADNLPGTLFIGQAYNAELYKPMPYAYPCQKRALSIVRRQSLKGYSELGEFSRKLFQIDKATQLVTFGFDTRIGYGGSFRGSHYQGLPDSDVVRLYSEGTVYVCASNHEGFGLPLLEAMSCGCPVATTRCDGNYFCEDDINCLMVDKGDMTGLAKAAYRIMVDEKLRKRLIEGGQETARQFADWDPVIDKLEQILLTSAVQPRP